MGNTILKVRGIEVDIDKLVRIYKDYTGYDNCGRQLMSYYVGLDKSMEEFEGTDIGMYLYIEGLGRRSIYLETYRYDQIEIISNGESLLNKTIREAEVSILLAKDGSTDYFIVDNKNIAIKLSVIRHFYRGKTVVNMYYRITQFLNEAGDKYE
jgi:hypothetical protein